MTSLEIVAGVAQSHELGPLGVEHGAHGLLVLERAVLDAVAVVGLAGPRREAGGCGTRTCLRMRSIVSS